MRHIKFISIMRYKRMMQYPATRAHLLIITKNKNIAVYVDHRVKINKRKKIEKYSVFTRELKNSETYSWR